MTADEFDLTAATGFATPGRRKNNLLGSNLPTTAHGSNFHFEVGSVWLSTSNIFLCTDATPGSASWQFVNDDSAPIDADYLVGTADGDLSNEIVVGATPGGELGGTWASPTVDATHSGSTHAAIQAAAEATAAADVDSDIVTHAAIVAAHHVKYTDAEAVTAIEAEDPLDLAGDLHVDVIAEETGAAGVTVEGVLLKDGLVDGVDVAARDHAVYTDAEAVTAMGVKGDANDLNHDKYTDGEVDAIVATHTADVDAHHAKYTDGEVDAIVATHTADVDAHHAKYTDAEAVTAVEAEDPLDLAGDLHVDVIAEETGAAGVTVEGVLLKDGLVDNVDVAARDHAKYTDAEAIAAVEGEATISLGTVETDTINEAGAGNGVTVDGVLLKDSGIEANEVAFPATQVPSAGANTLDDYEEGDFTPAIAFGGGTTGITYTSREGKYIKVGRIVNVSVRIILSSKGSDTGTATLTGFPFTSANDNSRSAQTAGYWNAASFASMSYEPGFLLNANAQSCVLYQGGTLITDANFTNNSFFIVNLTYRASA